MGVKAVFKEISLGEGQMEMSLAIYCDHATIKSKAPRIELHFDNGEDQRRVVMHNNAFEVNAKEGTAVAYSTYIWFLQNIFWNSKWDQCDIWIDVDYEGELHERVPIKVEFLDSEQKEYFKIRENDLTLIAEETVDATLRPQPVFISCIIAIVIRLVNIIVGLVLIPWFAIDVLGIMFLQTENRNNKIQGNVFKRFALYVGWRYFGFCRNNSGITGLKRDTFRLMYQFFSALHPNKNTILFMSNRRPDLTGNFEYVYEYLKDDPSLKIQFWLHPEEIRDAKMFELLDLARKSAKAKVMLVDDFVPYLSAMNISPKTEVMQLWHACGAFKTFGFSRIGKKGGPRQTSPFHRCYSNAFVSSKHIAKYYAEGFGLADKKVKAFGVPRTDIFFSEKYANDTREKLYAEYPMLKGKKVILFAPTFRGNGKNSAFYERKRFNPSKFIKSLSEDYVVIVKHHPFVQMTYEIEAGLENRVFDFSKESEINDLLFITDVLITDYSSVIYEASLLNVPMLFFAYDLENYVATRDFYSNDYEHFVPGKIVRTQKELVIAIQNKDFEHEKVDAFCKENFELRDGKSSERIAMFIKERFLTNF